MSTDAPHRKPIDHDMEAVAATQKDPTLAELQANAQRELEALLAEPTQSSKFVKNGTAAARSHLLRALYLARRRKGFTQGDLAAKIGSTQSAVARFESGKSNPSLDTLLKIARELDVTLTLESGIL